MVKLQDIPLKKRFGQHFLRKQSVIDHMIERVAPLDGVSVFEIGCGDGFLTKDILAQDIARLVIFEIDPDWADFIQKKYPDQRLRVVLQNFLDCDLSQELAEDKKWVLLANLPYQVTFPIFHKLVKNIDLLRDGVVMVQEEVAQKIVKTSGRGYGFVSLFFQHYFELTLMEKVPPGAFVPPPKVDSRLIYLKPRQTRREIPEEQKFWKFIKLCFRLPRRTLKNNLAQTHYNMDAVPAKYLTLRAQQMSMDDFIGLWNLLLDALTK